MNRSAFKALKLQMAAAGVTHSDIAYRLKCQKQTVYRKLARKAPWRLDEMYAVMDMIGASDADLSTLFPREG